LTDVGVFLLSRNEEKYIQKTLNCLINQKLKPKKIILVNDNSTDKTKQLVKKFPEVEIIDFPTEHPNWLMSPQFAKVYNFGLSKIKESGNYDYVMRLDSDHILPDDYLSGIIREMDMDKKLVVASGKIKGEESAKNVRGSGRVHRKSYLDLINWKHPINYGFESYIVLKAQSLGYSTKVLDIITETQRPTNTFKKKSEIYVIQGKAFRALGYSFPFVLFYALKKPKKEFKHFFLLFLGYFSPKVKMYDKDLANYLHHRQTKIIKKKCKNFLQWLAERKNYFLRSKETKIFWCKSGRNDKNFGDLITSYIYTKIKGKKPIYWNNKNTSDQVIFGSGSIMNLCKGWKNVVIWGSGIIDSNDTFDNPNQVLCVRGPFTRKRFLELGYNCPEKFGDIGLLLPRFYDYKIPQKYEIGVIPHFTDYENCKRIFANLPNVNVIDVCNEVEKVIDEIRKCKLIVSSSLHGIIVSHAYNIKSCWIKFSNFLVGDDIKFLDYFHSIGLYKVNKPILFDNESFTKSNKKEYLVNLVEKFPNPIFPLNTEALMKTCPF
jgi:glycosyltransferase involved in cell wall biosynthesis